MNELNLPSKEASTYKTILKLHLAKQYKRALKLCETILKKFPDHGQTLAMKGLCIYDSNSERKEEALALAREGIKNSMRSSTVWHIFGILNKSIGDLEQASKCFLQAYKLNPEDVNILRDLTYLLAQTRHLEEYNEYGRQLLTKSTPQRAGYWLAFAMSYHLIKDYSEALHVLDVYEDTLDAKKKSGLEAQDKVEFSERLLYRTLLLVEKGDVEEALDFALTNETHITDKTSLNEQLVFLYKKLDRNPSALETLEAMIKKNPENADYWRDYFVTAGLAVSVEVKADTSRNIESAGFLKIDPVSDDKLEQMLEMLDKYADTGFILPKRIPLDILPATSPKFKTRLDAYLRRGLRKGIVSLFSDLRSLYADDEKREIIDRLLREYLANLKKEPSRFSDDAESEIEGPSTLLRTTMYLAQHESKSGNHDAALEHIDSALTHTPTYIEAHLIKSKILKSLGAYDAAADVLDTARRMDLADRYINTKHCASLIRAHRVEEAEGVFQLFTKTDEPLSRGDGIPESTATPFTGLSDMQVLWFLTAAGDAYMNREGEGEGEGKGESGNIAITHDHDRGLALRMFKRAEKCYEIWRDDEADFHYYCMRKATLRSYLELLDWEDKVFTSSHYQRALSGMAKLYMSLYDLPPGEKEKKDEEAKFAGMTAQERKRAKNKLKKKQKKEEAEKEKAAKEKEKDKKAGGKKIDYDPIELELEKEPLLAAKKALVRLLLYSSDRIDTHCIEFDLYFRLGNVLRCVHALNSLHRCDGDAGSRVRAILPRLSLFLKRVWYADEKKKEKEQKDSIQYNIVKKTLKPIIAQFVSDPASTSIDVDVESQSLSEWLQRVSEWVLNTIGSDSKSKSGVWSSLISRCVLGQSACILDSEFTIPSSLIAITDDSLKLSEASAVYRLLKKNVNGNESSSSSSSSSSIDRIKISEDAVTEYREQCRNLFPKATIFSRQ